ncbi:MAG: monovalent cation/H+ antiporter subunit D family protein [Elusimicrobiota bacterium]
MTEYRPLWAVLVSLAAVPLILLSDRRPNLRESWTFLAAFAKVAIVASMLPDVLAGAQPEVVAFALGPGLSLHLRADPAGMVFALLASTLWILTSLYSIGYMRANKSGHQTAYFASFAVCLSAAIGIAFAANLLTFFVFFEILTIATYPLVTHNRTQKAVAGGRKYLAYTLIAGQMLLIALIWAQSLAGAAEFRPGGFLGGVDASPAVLRTLFLFFIIGIGVKAAILPLHGWLPAAMVAPTPVSALLHAVAVVKAGAFGCVRVTGYVFGPELMRSIGADWALACFAAATILVGSLRALGETDLKRRLAYSTVSQLSYIVLGAALGSPAAVAGAIFHIAAHGFMKISLFFCAGSIYTRTHFTQIEQLSGLGRRMPLTMLAFAVGALGMAGTPLLAGFVSKWNLGLGAVHSGHEVFIAVLVASAILNFAYFFPIVYEAFFGGGKTPVRYDEAGAALWLPPVAAAAGALVLGVCPDAFWAFYRLAWMAAAAVTGVPGVVG